MRTATAVSTQRQQAIERCLTGCANMVGISERCLSPRWCSLTGWIWVLVSECRGVRGCLGCRSRQLRHLLDGGEGRNERVKVGVGLR